jgi:hypothetical protein
MTQFADYAVVHDLVHRNPGKMRTAPFRGLAMKLKKTTAGSNAERILAFGFQCQWSRNERQTICRLPNALAWFGASPKLGIAANFGWGILGDVATILIQPACQSRNANEDNRGERGRSHHKPIAVRGADISALGPRASLYRYKQLRARDRQPVLRATAPHRRMK